MADPLTAGAIAASLANLITDILKDSTKDALKEGADEGKKRLLGWFGKNATLEAAEQAIFSMSQKYVETYQERHGILKVLGMREPVSLELVYTAVCFLDQDVFFHRFASRAELEAAYRQDRARRLRQQLTKRHEGIKVANEKQFLMVLGAPGSGKSTFLRKMGLEVLKGSGREYEHHCIPVFLELKRFNSKDIDLEKRIINEFETCGFPDAQRFTNKALEEGKLLILLDGLDEVPSRYVNRTILAIQDFVDRHKKNRYIASCRIAAYRNSFRRFSDVVMAEFEDDQIQKYIGNWFRSAEDQKSDTAAKCWQVLQQHPGARELAHSPLLLTFLCLVYDHSQNFPSNRSTLYRKALRILLEEWAAEKRLENQRQIYEGLSVELEESLLSEIAAKGFNKDQLFFSQRELVERIKAFLASNLNAPKHLDGEAVLEAIAVQQGILVERAEDAYSFSHLTLQEHLTAQYIVDNLESIQFIAKYLTDKRWREVFLLIAGLMPGSKGADPLLQLMEKKTQNYINTPKLKALLRWAEQATSGSVGSYKPVAKRAASIVLVLVIALDRDRALANELDLAHYRALDLAPTLDRARTFLACYHELACELDRTHEFNRVLDRTIYYAYEFQKIKIFSSVDFIKMVANLQVLKAQIPGVTSTFKARLSFFDDIRQLWFNALKLNLEAVMLSKDEANALADYFYACELMVQCKKAAVRVSPQTWEAIEGRMLLPPD